MANVYRTASNSTLQITSDGDLHAYVIHLVVKILFYTCFQTSCNGIWIKNETLPHLRLTFTKLFTIFAALPRGSEGWTAFCVVFFFYFLFTFFPGSRCFMHLNILADLANHRNHAPGRSKILFLCLKSLLHLILEKVLVAIRDWRLWEKAHRQKVLPEHALQWLWEERQQSQTCVKIRAIKQRKPTYYSASVTGWGKESILKERRSSKKKKKAKYRKHTEKQNYAFVFVFIAVFAYSSSHRKRRMILFGRGGCCLFFFCEVIYFFF